MLCSHKTLPHTEKCSCAQPPLLNIPGQINCKGNHKKKAWNPVDSFPAPSLSFLHLISLPDTNLTSVTHGLSLFHSNIIKGREPLTSLLNCNKVKSSTRNVSKSTRHYWNYLICKVSTSPPYSTTPKHFTGAAALSRCISELRLIIWFWCSVSMREDWNYRINDNLIFNSIIFVYFWNKCIQEKKYKIEQKPLQFIY